MSLLGRLIVFGLTASQVIAAGADTKPDPAGVQFFEQKIRPVLVQHCYECHSAEAKSKKRLKAQLYLDSKAGLTKGGESGPVLAGAKPADSLLVKALRGLDVSAMPPKGRLPEAVIADFESWVKMAPLTLRTGGDGPKGRTIDVEQGRKFWSYKMPEKPALPAVKDTAWPAGDIDRFVLAKLEAAGLRPARDADPAVLVRRIYFDLVGLPPTPEQIDEFVAAHCGSKPQTALEELVDRLLASPQFGERWGRHWLDVARFAESLTLRGFVFKEAWRYRDYVIDAFNADMPYDRFIREQIAGDLLPAATTADRRRQLTAVTFLVLGNANLEEQDKKQLVMDVVDDQLDTLGKAFLAQTIGCARCHDHKFDPIPTRDYYAMAGILKNTRTLEHANVSKWLEMPLPIDPALEEGLKKHETAVAALQARIKNEKAKLVTAGRVMGEKPDKAGKTVKPAGVLAINDLPGIVVDETAAKAVGQWQASKYSGTFIGAGYAHDMNAGKGEKTLTFHPELPGPGKYEVLFAYSPGTNRAAEVPVTILSAEGEKVVHVDQQKTPPLDGRFISLGQYRFESKEQGYVIVSNEGTKGHVTADAVVFLPLDGPAAKTAKPTGEKPETGKAESAKPASGDADELKKLEAELKRLEESGPRREMVMSVKEEAKIADTYIHIRGSVMNVGETAPRGFLQVAAYGPKPAMPAKESGRRELADWLAGAGNPLTAQVMANRVWHWLFGVGLVRTVDNFGTTGETPSHLELLDSLALRFAEEGWSVKKLVRAIVLSRTYRQGSADADNSSAPAAKVADPENRLLWKANRRRLDAECIRDGMLQIAGTLKTERGGPTFASTLSADYGYKHTDTRRSVYAPVFRNSLPEALDAFDFADTGMVTGRRNVSTVAPQALFLMNHPFVLEQARQAALRLTKESGLDEPAQVARAYRLTLGRNPTEREIATARRFLGASPKPDDWAALIQALFASMDFRYVN